MCVWVFVVRCSWSGVFESRCTSVLVSVVGLLGGTSRFVVWFDCRFSVPVVNC